MLRIGIVGCGNIFVMHAVSAQHYKNATIVAVCDIKEDRAKEKSEKYNCKAYTDYKLMIQNEKLDVLHICLPHYLHTIVATYALSEGVNVITEKPMSIDYESGVKVVELAREKGLLYGVILQCRYNDASQFVKKHIETDLGKVLCARVVLTWSRSDDYYSKSDWKGTWEYEGGGVVIDQAIHSLDLANWCIDDKITKVQSVLMNHKHKIMQVDDTAEGYIEYAGGATLSFWATNNYKVDEPIEVRLRCENGNAIFSYDDATIIFNDGKELKPVITYDKIDYGAGKDYWGFSHARQIHQYYRAVEKLEPLEITGEEALKTEYLISQIYEQGKKNFIKLG